MEMNKVEVTPIIDQLPMPLSQEDIDKRNAEIDEKYY